MTKIKCLYGYSVETRSLHHIEEAIANTMDGLKCPSCLSPLLRVNGQKMAKHFRHEVDTNGRYCAESSLHIRAKTLFSEMKDIAIYVKCDKELVYITDECIKTERVLSKTLRGSVVKSTLELRDTALGIIPDCTLTVDFGIGFCVDVLVEVMVTHAVDEKKLGKIFGSDHIAFEINLSKVDRDIGDPELRKIVADSTRYMVINTPGAVLEGLNYCDENWFISGTTCAENAYIEYIKCKLKHKEYYESIASISSYSMDIKTTDMTDKAWLEKVMVEVKPSSITVSAYRSRSEINRADDLYPTHKIICDNHHDQNWVLRYLKNKVTAEIPVLDDFWLANTASIIKNYSRPDEFLPETIQEVCDELSKDYSRLAFDTDMAPVYSLFFPDGRIGSVVKRVGDTTLVNLFNAIEKSSNVFLNKDDVADDFIGSMKSPSVRVFNEIISRFRSLEDSCQKYKYDFQSFYSHNPCSNGDKENLNIIEEKLRTLTSIVYSLDMDNIEKTFNRLILRLCESGVVSVSSEDQLIFDKFKSDTMLKNYFNKTYWKNINIAINGTDNKLKSRLASDVNKDFSIINSISDTVGIGGYLDMIKKLSRT